jgi:nucleotide-binding universal stress UspA family protein
VIHLQEEDSLMDVRHLLVPTDFSEGAKQAFAYAVGVARTCGAKLTLLHVVELPFYLSDGHTPAHTTTALRDHMQESAQQELARLLPEGAGTPVEIARQVAVGVPYQKILETAAAEQVDWIVMATHGWLWWPAQ